MSDDDYDLDDEQTDTDELNDDDGKIDTELVADTDDDEEVSADELAAAASAHSSLAARNKIREAMQAEIEAFLAKGGKIQQVEDKDFLTSLIKTIYDDLPTPKPKKKKQ